MLLIVMQKSLTHGLGGKTILSVVLYCNNFTRLWDNMECVSDMLAHLIWLEISVWYYEA